MIPTTIPQLRRSDDDRVVAGVCAGIAEVLDVDPTLVRLIFAVLALAGGAGIALYIAAYLYMTGRGWIALVALLVALSIVLGGDRALEPDGRRDRARGRRARADLEARRLVRPARRRSRWPGS